MHVSLPPKSSTWKDRDITFWILLAILKRILEGESELTYQRASNPVTASRYSALL
jgi:hypothetical protein